MVVMWTSSSVMFERRSVSFLSGKSWSYISKHRKWWWSKQYQWCVKYHPDDFLMYLPYFLELESKRNCLTDGIQQSKKWSHRILWVKSCCTTFDHDIIQLGLLVLRSKNSQPFFHPIIFHLCQACVCFYPLCIYAQLCKFINS